MREPAMRLPDALALGSAVGWATFDACDRMAARLVRVICEQDERITALGVRVLVRDDRIREAWDVVGRLESSRDELEAECDDAIHLIDELVTALEIERQDHEVDRVELGYWRQLAQQQAAS